MATDIPEAGAKSRAPSRLQKVHASFTNLQAATNREQVELLLKPFTIERWSENENTVVSNDVKKSVNIDFIGLEEQRSGVQMMRDLCRLWCRSNRSSVPAKGAMPPTEDHQNSSSTSGWLEFRQYDGDNSRVKKADAVHVLTMKSISFGAFKDQYTFVNHACIGQSTHTLQAKFEHDLRSLSVVLHERGTDIVKKVEMGYYDLEAYVIVDVLLDGFRIFLPLLYPPKLYSSELKEHMPYVVHPQIVTEGILWNRDISVSDSTCNADTIGKCSVVCLEYRKAANTRGSNIEESPLWPLYTRLQRNGFSVYFSAINGVQHQPLTWKPDHNALQDFDTLYAMESLLSRGSKFLDRCTPGLMKLISQAPPNLIASAITDVAHVWLEDDRFCNLEEALNTELVTLQSVSENDSTAEELPPHYVNIRRVVVTPTRIIFLRAETVVQNRTVREYGADRFLRVAFRDEDYCKLMSPVPRFMTKITDRIKSVLKHGIRVGSRCYEFLACSNSQLRDHGCWFFVPDGTQKTRIKSVRRWMGDLSEERCVASYVARMGQFFSSSKDTKRSVEDLNVQEIADVETPYRTPRGTLSKYCFSDGVGTISQDLAADVSKALDMESTPSAFQIRYAGCKGVVSTWPHPTDSNGKTKVMQIRPSMKKFESKHKSLEVMATTHPGQLFLNRQVITLLSQLGIRDEEFIQRQDQMLYRLAEMFLDEDRALEALLRAQPRVRFTQLKAAGFSLTSDPHFREILHAVHATRLDELLRRTRIEIDISEGRIMMGIMDETRTLEYGQVFVQYSNKIHDEKKESTIVSGDVMVTKNPCFHPGDVRKFQAVDVEALHHCVDCIVFPSKGKRPHPNEISGSDLDGDMYFVTWAPGFQILNNQEAMDYTSQPKKKLNREVTEEDIQEFVANYISSDQLGLIANAHLANADIQKKAFSLRSA
ncbi:uncharacterized protein [Amphiura filiformis]|uniref:uncharacterized protein n=1 Tax=Amphiura filiformis TaxID=82378 RepID=UPI003B213BE1